jgi:hypothetical protein
MSTYVVDTVISRNPDDYLGMTRIWFTAGGVTAYMFVQPGNDIEPGQPLEGSMSTDKRGNNKFTKAKTFPGAPPKAAEAQQLEEPFESSPPLAKLEAPAATWTPPAKTYKADPDKLKQEYSLDVAKNMSIQRQVAVKSTIDLIVAGKRKYSQLIGTYCDLMEILSEPDWRELEELKEMEESLPPVELYDNVPDDIPSEEEYDEFVEKIDAAQKAHAIKSAKKTT